MIRSWHKKFAKFKPAEFFLYLRGAGWTEEETPHGHSTIFLLEKDAGTAEVEIPNSQSYADYQRRIAQAVEVLIHVEQIDPYGLLQSLEMPSIDILQFRITGQEVSNGTIPLDDALRIRRARKQLLLSAAHSVVEPLPHFSRLSRSEPAEFYKKCREAPSRPGSFISEVLVPVGPDMGKLDIEEPFARQTTQLLATALSYTYETLERGDQEKLLNGYASGLSSNFLKALSELNPPGSDGALEIGFRWSAKRAKPNIPNLPPSITFSSRVFDTIGEAARVLHQSSSVPNYELEGFVAQLTRETEDSEASGDVVIVASVEDEPRTTKVRIRLSAEAYSKAAKAHAEVTRVAVTGTLIRKGRKISLKEPSGFRILSFED